MLESRCRFNPAILFLLPFAILATGLNATADEFRLRLVASNLSSGNYQSYDPGEGLRILDGINPDVALMQEFNYGNNTAADFRSLVDTAFGPEFSYYRQPGGLQIPNGIISRYPILQAGVWDDTQVSNRDFVWARIDIPGNVDLWVVSVHLLTASEAVRNTEATALLQFINANVPAADYLAIGGDFNTNSRSESAFSTLGPIVNTAGPYPVDQNGNGNTNASRAKPYDGVYVDSDLQAHAMPVLIGSSTFVNGLVVDTRVFTPLSQISPALLSDSGATNMQHMGVVKDFVITAPEPNTATLLVFGLSIFLLGRRRPSN